MRLESAFLPLLLHAVAALPPRHHGLHERQISPSMFTSAATGAPKGILRVKSLVPQIDTKATRELVMWGPFKLPGSNSSHSAPGLQNGIKLDKNSDNINANLESPCTNCTVIKAIANLAYKDGTPADVESGVYTHHIIMTQTGRKQLMNPVQPPMCVVGGLLGLGGQPGANGGHGHMAGGHSKRQAASGTPDFLSWLDKLMPTVAVFVGGGGSAGSGAAFAGKSSVIKTGAFISQTDKFAVSSELVNYDPKEKEIYITLDFEYVQGKAPGLLNVGMGALSVDDCSSPGGVIQPPKGKAVTYKGVEWTMLDDGYFVSFTPHLHDGGVYTKIFLNGKEICEARALYGTSQSGAAKIDGQTWQTISDYVHCEKTVPFKKGDKVYMTAEYDLAKYRLRPDSANHEMGAEAMALATFIWARAA